MGIELLLLLLLLVVGFVLCKEIPTRSTAQQPSTTEKETIVNQYHAIISLLKDEKFSKIATIKASLDKIVEVFGIKIQDEATTVDNEEHFTADEIALYEKLLNQNKAKGKRQQNAPSRKPTAAECFRERQEKSTADEEHISISSSDSSSEDSDAELSLETNSDDSNTEDASNKEDKSQQKDEFICKERKTPTDLQSPSPITTPQFHQMKESEEDTAPLLTKLKSPSLTSQKRNRRTNVIRNIKPDNLSTESTAGTEKAPKLSSSENICKESNIVVATATGKEEKASEEHVPSLIALSRTAPKLTKLTKSSTTVTTSFNSQDDTEFISSFAAAENMNRAGIKRVKKEIRQEDRHFAEYPFRGRSDLGVFCVFDGFSGAEAADRCATAAPNIVEEVINASGLCADMGDALRAIIAKLDETVYSFDNGCTGTVALAWRLDGKVYVQSANVGDSNGFLFSGEHETELTEEHKVKKEIPRLQRDGIAITEKATRLNGVAIARALGVGFLKDAKSGLIATPYVSQPVEASGATLIVCCDGIWDVFQSTAAGQIAKEFTTAQDAAKRLIDRAIKDPKCTDNLTAIVVFFK